MLDRITFDPKVMGGRACIRGMRIPASVIVGQIARGGVRRDPPGLPGPRDDIPQTLEYARLADPGVRSFLCGEARP